MASLPVWFRVEYMLAGALLASNVLLIMVNLRLHRILQRIFLAGILTGRIDPAN